MFKILLSILLISLTLSACGGARGPDHTIGAASVTGNSVISWQPPTTYSDLSPLSLSDIGGYQIYVGTSEDSLRLNTNISDPAITELSLSKLGKGIRYIAVSCYDVSGIESGFSPIIIVNIL